MCQLLRRGLIAALAPAGVPNADIVVTDQIGQSLSAIQVKARVAKGSDGGWHMKAKHEAIRSPNLLYAFVDFGSSHADHPACFIVPSEVVGDVLARAHAAWLAAPGKRGQPRNDTVMRRLLPDYGRLGISIGHGAGWMERYRDAWHLIG